MLSKIKSKPTIVAAALGLIGIFAYVFINSPTSFVYDSSIYYDISEQVAAGTFDFTGIRGVLFPIVLVIQRFVFGFTAMNIHQIVSVGNTLLFLVALFFIVKHFSKLFFKGKNLSISQCLLLSEVIMAVVLLLYKDCVVQPLSDVMAVLATILAVVCAVKVGDALASKKIFWSIFYSALTGGFLYFAYNTRTIYLFSGFAFIIVFIIYNLRHKWKMLICCLCMVLGVIGIALPQIIGTYQNTNKISLALSTSHSGYGSLFTFQLYSGLYMQRYDTFLGDASIFPQPAMIFNDPAGLMIYDELTHDSDEATMGEYIKIALEKPFDMVALYFRHFVNLISCYFFQTYVTTLAVPPIIPLTICFIIEALIVLMIVYATSKDGLKINLFKSKEFIFALSIVVAGLFIVPGAVEFRFSIPILLPGIIALALFLPSHLKEFMKYLKLHWIGLSVTVLAVYISFLNIWSNTLATAVKPLGLF